MKLNIHLYERDTIVKTEIVKIEELGQSVLNTVSEFLPFGDKAVKLQLDKTRFLEDLVFDFEKETQNNQEFVDAAKFKEMIVTTNTEHVVPLKDFPYSICIESSLWYDYLYNLFIGVINYGYALFFNFRS